MIQIQLTERQLATVLAALRLWQNQRSFNLAILDIATNGDQLDPLNTDEIDQLCEEINQ